MDTNHARKSLTLAAGIMATVVGVSLPALFLYQGISSERSASDATARAYAIAINRVIARFPDSWRFQDNLLRDVVELGTTRSNAAAREESLRIVGSGGDEIFATSELPAAPRVSRRAALSDSGVTVGNIEYTVSLRPLAIQTLLVSLLGVALGGLIFAVLRSLPLRAVDRALAALEQEVNRAEAALAEKASAEETLRENEAQLRLQAQSDQLLESLAVAANSARTPEEAISLCLRQLCDFTGWPLGHAALLEIRGEFAIARADFWHGAERDHFTKFVETTNGFHYPLKDGRFVAQVLRSNSPVWLKNLQLAGRFKDFAKLDGSGLVAGMCFPIARGHEVIGFFEFFTSTAIEPDSVLSDLILRASAHVGRVAERVAANEEIIRLNADLERRVAERGAQMEQTNALLTTRNRETSLLAEMTSVLQIAADLNEAGMLVSRFLPAILQGSEGGALYLMRASRDHLERLSNWGKDDSPASFAPSHCWGMRRGQPHGSRQGSVPLECTHLVTSESAGGSLCLPLIAQGDSLGMLQIGYTEHHGDEQWQERVTSAKRAAEQLSLALANVRLRESLREQSIRDPLTGLHNRRYLEESLSRELARCIRDGQPLALFMLDVDHFKRYNDVHGHEGGDAVLRELGRELRESARASDIICRYGGEEFTAVLPNTSEIEASNWSERLMRKVRAMEVRQGNRALPAVTVSMGLAVCPQHGTGAEQLLHAADFALYDAKHAGRDRLKVVEATEKNTPPKGSKAA